MFCSIPASRVTNYDLRLTNYELRVTDHELRITAYEKVVHSHTRISAKIIMGGIIHTDDMITVFYTQYFTGE